MTYIKKLTSLLAICSIIHSPLFAGSHMDHKKSKMSRHEKKYGYMRERCTNFFIYGAYTYWQVYQQGMYILQSNGNGLQEGSVISPNTGYRNGFKVGLGANNTFDGWHFGATYTWFYNFPGVRTNTLIDGQSYLGYLAGDSGFTLSTCRSKFVNYFNRVDAFFDKDFYSGTYFTFRPAIGFLGAWEHQKLYYEGEGVGDESTTTYNVDLKQRWYGIGPYTRFASMCNFSKNFAIFLNPGLAMLFSEHFFRNDQSSIAPNGTITPEVLYPHNFFNIEPMLELSLGFSFNADYENFYANITAAWEIQTYFAHNGFSGFYAGLGSLGDYSMNGLTVGLRLGF